MTVPAKARGCAFSAVWLRKRRQRKRRLCQHQRVCCICVSGKVCTVWQRQRNPATGTAVATWVPQLSQRVHRLVTSTQSGHGNGSNVSAVTVATIGSVSAIRPRGTIAVTVTTVATTPAPYIICHKKSSTYLSPKNL